MSQRSSIDEFAKRRKSKLDRRVRSVYKLSIIQEATCLSRSVPNQLVIVIATPPQSNSGSARGSDKVCTASMLSSPQGVRVRLLASFLPILTPPTSLPFFTSQVDHYDSIEHVHFATLLESYPLLGLIELSGGSLTLQ